MIIQFYQDEQNYVIAKLQENVGSFMEHFLRACLYADTENYEIIRPVLQSLMIKQPLRTRGYGTRRYRDREPELDQSDEHQAKAD